MDWNKIIGDLLIAVVPAIITYLATSKKCKIEMLEAKHKYEIDLKRLEYEKETLEKNHQHELEMLKEQSSVNKDEMMNNVLASIMGTTFTGMMNGTIDPDKIQELANRFTKK